MYVPIHQRLYITGIHCIYRNQEFQEEMWRTSIAIVRDYLSPDVLEWYGPRADQSDGAPVGDESETTLPITTDMPEQSHEKKQVARWEIRRVGKVE